MARREYKRSWKNLLLDRSYQLRFTLLMVVVSAVFLVGLGAFVHKQAVVRTTIALDNIRDTPVGAMAAPTAARTVRPGEDLPPTASRSTGSDRTPDPVPPTSRLCEGVTPATPGPCLRTAARPSTCPPGGRPA